MSALHNFAGPQAVKALEKVRHAQANKDDWPYVHLFPPPNSLPVHQIGYVAVPNAASSAVIVAYQVPEGFRFIMHAILASFSGAFNPGDSLFTVDVNTPVGTADAQATFVQGLIRVPVTLGSWEYGVQWPFARPYEFAALDLIQLKGLNVNLNPGSPYYVGGFFGYLIPSR